MSTKTTKTQDETGQMRDALAWLTEAGARLRAENAATVEATAVEVEADDATPEAAPPTKIDEYEAELGEIPAQVREVAEAWLACAMRAAEMIITDMDLRGADVLATRRFWSDRIFVSMDSRRRSNGGPRWTIGDNHERSMYLVHYPASDEWHTMRPYGEECLMRGGHAEALANAEIIWHG